MEGLEETISVHLQRVYDSRSSTELALGSLYMIEGLERVIESAAELLESSGTMMAMPFPEMLADDRIARALLKASSTRPVKLLVDERTLGIALEKLSASKVSIRARDKLFGGGVIGREVLFVVEGREGLVGLRSGMGFFVELARVYFEYLWRDAEVVSIG